MPVPISEFGQISPPPLSSQSQQHLLPKHILRSGIVIEQQLFPDIRYCRRVVFVVVVGAYFYYFPGWVADLAI